MKAIATTMTASRRTPIMPRKALINAIAFGFGCGTHSVYKLFERYAQDDNIPVATKEAAIMALTIFKRHEVEEARNFNPEDYIVSDDEGQYEEE